MIYGAQSIVRDQKLCELFVFALQKKQPDFAADETFQNQQTNKSVLFDFFFVSVFTRVGRSAYF